MKSLITGGAGFIGSNLAQKLVEMGDEVIVLDNFSSGYRENLKNLNVELVEMDICDKNIIHTSAFRGVNRVFHLAANVDNRFSWEDPTLSLRNNIDGTLNVGLACKENQVSQIIYASTGTIYGDSPDPPYAEHLQTSHQTTLYGATKYSAEGILSVIATHFKISCLVFRFVGVLGPNTSHGHLFDFMRRLRANPNSLKVLGNGNQKKAYVDVDDVINALIHTKSKNFDVFNLGRSDFSTVKDSIKWMCEELEIMPIIQYEENDRGWIGDNPHLYLDIKKLHETGWRPTRTIEESVKRTVRWIAENPSRLELNHD